MKAWKTLSSAAVLILAMTGCNQAPPPPPDTHDAELKEISDTEAQWNKDYAAKDADKITSYYADDAVLMVPGMDAMRGKEAIHTGIKQWLADPALTLTFEASKVEVAKSGDLGYTQGSYKMTMTDPATKKVANDHGSYVTTYRKQADGSWKASADIATSSVPPMPPPKKR